jgi:putative transcriptional regulator
VGIGLGTFVRPEAALAAGEFAPSSVKKGVLLIASPSLNDPNFRETVVLIIEHGFQGTLGVILNRSLKTLLSDALPDVSALKGTSHRLFAGGPVEMTRLHLLFRVKDPPPAGTQSVIDGIYFGGTPEVLERILTQGTPAERFRAFAGVSGWGPGQLSFEMLQGAWGVLPPDAIDVFDQDPATLWQTCIGQLQAPRVISH